MKTWATLVRAVQVVVKATSPTARTSDPFYSDDARRAAVNAASPRGRRRWVPRRSGWLR